MSEEPKVPTVDLCRICVILLLGLYGIQHVPIA